MKNLFKMDVDLYEFKENLGDYNDFEGKIDILHKSVGLIKVLHLDTKARDKLIKQGYQPDDEVLVIIQ